MQSTSTPQDIKLWKATKRKELLALREAIAPDDRKQWSAQITAQLLAGFPQLASMVVGVY